MKASYVFCLETVKDLDNLNESKLLPFLENVALQFDIPNVYKACDDIESFENSLQILLYEDRLFKDYNILYFVVAGNGSKIKFDDYYYTFDEIAELFEGKLTNKIIHFANTFLLNIDEEEAQYFIDITGARGISGYNNSAPIFSSVLDGFYFDMCQHYADPVELVETLFDEKYALCKSLGFTFYY